MQIGKYWRKFIKKEVVVKEVIKTDIRDFSKEERELYDLVKPYTMTSPERVKALSDSVKYLINRGIEGDFVECGVWKGGSVLAMISVLALEKNYKKDIFLYDTFEGMSEPTINDIDPQGRKAKDRLAKEDKDTSWVWAKAHLEEVKANILKSGYPENKIHFIKGKVEDTLKNNKPERISLLRLDTDWYESTKVELEELYDNVVSGGIIIIDDYGHWAGCKKAVDEFFQTRKIKVFLNRIDYTCRLIVKP